ncbi:MoaD/ThiS family protein [Dactylosporangium maewongense]|uniref:MoaD/ThiS family protein n=1 Tax=Dactylosporangium maewongense TaxID=634393 RepID=A0ABN1ZQT9_9ACTN
MTAVLLVRYFAGARAAAGVPEEKVEAATLGELMAVLTHDRPRLASVLTACSFLVDGTSWRDREAALPSTATVDVLPPFAGG